MNASRRNGQWTATAEGDKPGDVFAMRGEEEEERERPSEEKKEKALSWTAAPSLPLSLSLPPPFGIYARKAHQAR